MLFHGLRSKLALYLDYFEWHCGFTHFIFPGGLWMGAVFIFPGGLWMGAVFIFPGGLWMGAVFIFPGGLWMGAVFLCH